MGKRGLGVVWLVCVGCVGQGWGQVGGTAGKVEGAAVPAAAVPAAVAVPVLSPGAAYRAAMRPVEVTRASVANWSDTEQAALGVAVKEAGEACGVRSAGEYEGEALVDLARLCALGMQWPAVVAATGKYIAADAALKPLLADAYAGKVDAELHMKDEAAALKSAREMVLALPYGTLVGEATGEALNYMELLYTDDAVSLAGARQAKLLMLLGAGTGAQPGVAELYRQGLRLAELQQLEGKTAEAKATVAALDAALPGDAGSDEMLTVAGARVRYGQLGRPVAGLGLPAAVKAPVYTGGKPVVGAVQAFVLFPDWCAQCVRLAMKIPAGVFTVEGRKAYVYGLLVETVVPAKGARTGTGFDPARTAEVLRDTPTVVVSADVLKAFYAVEVPLLIVADAAGVIRFIEPVDEGALQPGNTLDVAVGLVGKRWPGAGVR